MATKDEDGQELLSKDKVEATMDRLVDVIADQQEVDQAMSDGTDLLLESTLSGGIDNDELEAELDALEDEEVARATPSRSTAKTVASSKEHISPERPLASKKAIPPLPNDPFVSPLYSSTSAASGKRVADIPELASVKQRKVSQATIHSPRVSSAGLEPSEMANSLEYSQDNIEEAQSMVTDSSSEAYTSTRMETDRDGLESVDQKTMEPSRYTGKEREMADLTSQEERELEALLTDLGDIHAPKEDIPMKTADSRDRSAGLSENEDEAKEEMVTKTRKETRLMEHS